MLGLPASCTVTSHIRRRASSGMARSCRTNATLLRKRGSGAIVAPAGDGPGESLRFL